MTQTGANDPTALPAEPTVGVPEPFERFFERERARVLALTLSLSRRPSAAEDVTQEAFLRAFRDWDRIGRYEQPSAWVKRVATNLAVSQWRRVQAEVRAISRLGRVRSVDEPALDDEQLWREVRRLPSRQSQVIALTYVDGLSSDEVAAVLAIEASTVRQHLTRARRTLESRLGDPNEH